MDKYLYRHFNENLNHQNANRSKIYKTFAIKQKGSTDHHSSKDSFERFIMSIEPLISWFAYFPHLTYLSLTINGVSMWLSQRMTEAYSQGRWTRASSDVICKMWSNWCLEISIYEMPIKSWAWPLSTVEIDVLSVSLKDCSPVINFCVRQIS